MSGLRIFTHSLRQVTGNLEGAIRVSLLPYAIQIGISLLLLGHVEALAMAPEDMGGGIPLVILPVILVVLITALWIAVAWHRYVLRNERPAGLLPAFLPDRIGAYFLRSLGIGLIVIAAAFVIGLVVSLVAGMLVPPSVVAGLLMGLLVYVPVVVIALRLSAALPGSALGDDSDFMAGWRATEGKSGDLIGLAVITVALNLALGLIGTYVFSGLPILAIGWDAIVGWFVMMVGISILTTLYGHYVEGRPLL